MTACASEVPRYCADVSQGRGHISACLASYMGQLGAACLPEVQAVGRSRLTPRYVRNVFDPAFRAPLPQACVAPAAQFCPGMAPGEGRVFACLYAHSNRVGKACSDAAQATLKQANGRRARAGGRRAIVERAGLAFGIDTGRRAGAVIAWPDRAGRLARRHDSRGGGGDGQGPEAQQQGSQEAEAGEAQGPGGGVEPSSRLAELQDRPKSPKK